jgi:hypothetical protein
MAGLVAPLADLACPCEQPVHRPLRREVRALVEEGRVHRRGRSIDEALRVEDLEDPEALLLCERSRRRRSRPALRRWHG